MLILADSSLLIVISVLPLPVSIFRSKISENFYYSEWIPILNLALNLNLIQRPLPHLTDIKSLVRRRAGRRLVRNVSLKRNGRYFALLIGREVRGSPQECTGVPYEHQEHPKTKRHMSRINMGDTGGQPLHFSTRLTPQCCPEIGVRRPIEYQVLQDISFKLVCLSLSVTFSSQLE